MNNEFYYNTKTIPLAERETFNNTILLLTMVKSQYYYIVGFSRPDNIIEIAFDFDSDLHGFISESVTVDFGSDGAFVLMQCNLRNVAASDVGTQLPFSGDGLFTQNGNDIVYRYKVRKDKLIPTSMEQMNQYILLVKNEIVAFLEAYYAKYLS